MRISRRDFTRGILGAAGFAVASNITGAKAARKPFDNMPHISSTFKGVALGCNTFSVVSLPLDDAITAIKNAGYGMAELHPWHLEPAFGGRRGGGRRGVPPTPEQAAAAVDNRQKLRDWRLTVPLEQISAVRKKFTDAGLYLYAYNMNYNDDFTDDEIDRSFQMTQALGCDLITAVGSKSLFRRLDPFAQKHQVWVGIHNEVNTLPTVADFDEVLHGLSRWTGMTLDVGHFEASNSDPVSCLETHRDLIFNLHLKDRKKNGGPSLPFGQGDTPITQLLQIDRGRHFRIPANVEYDGTGDRVQAIRTCFEYCKQALLS